SNVAGPADRRAPARRLSPAGSCDGGAQSSGRDNGLRSPSGRRARRRDQAMSETTLGALRQLLLDRYDEIKTRLALRVGSTDLASDALQDTWVRLSLGEPLGPVRSLENYLFRIVFNMVQERRRSERRLLSAVEVENLLSLADELPDPAQT